MPLNDHVYHAEEKKMAEAVGYAITLWCRVEVHTLLICARALRMEEKSTAKLVTNFRAFSLVLDFTHTAVKNRLDGNPELKFWNSLIDYLRELSGDRNFIVHAGIIPHAPGHPDKVDWAEVTPMIGPPVDANLAGNEKIPPMSIEEVHELCADFQHALDLMVGFLKAWDNGGSFPEKFRKPISRRRPPRKERLEGGQKSP